jgi:hypothetical protein
MKYFAPATPIILRSDFSPDECERRLRGSIDIEQPTMFGFSGYRGSKPFLGGVDGKTFHVLQRVYSSRNSFPAVLTGELQPQGVGTRVKGQFDLELNSKIAICLFDVVGLFILVLIVAVSHASHPVLVPVFVCGFGGLIVFSPRIFRAQVRDQEKAIADFLRDTLVASDDVSSSASGSAS